MRRSHALGPVTAAATQHKMSVPSGTARHGQRTARCARSRSAGPGGASDRAWGPLRAREKEAMEDEGEAFRWRHGAPRPLACPPRVQARRWFSVWQSSSPCRPCGPRTTPAPVPRGWPAPWFSPEGRSQPDSGRRGLLEAWKVDRRHAPGTAGQGGAAATSSGQHLTQRIQLCQLQM